MLRIKTLEKKETKMETNLIILVLILTLLNMGLVILALGRLNALRKDLRTPVVKKFNTDFKKKAVDIPKTPENFVKNQRDGRANNQQNSQQNRQKSGQQNSRPQAQIRRPAAKAPDVFSNEATVQEKPQTSTEPTTEGRRPLPPRNVVAANAMANQTAVEQPVAVANNNASNNVNEDIGMEFDRSKMAHGRRNMIAKPIIEDDETKTETNA